MEVSIQAISQLEALVEKHEQEKGIIDLQALVTTNCQCTGSHCSNGCSGNKGNIW